MLIGFGGVGIGRAIRDRDLPVPPGGVVRRMLVTAYCPCEICCGRYADGITASGKPVTYNGGRFVAADRTLLDFHRRVAIPGYHGGQPVPVLDVGGKIKGDHLDAFFPTHAQARAWGARRLNVVIYPDDRATAGRP